MVIEKSDMKKIKSIQNTFHLPTWITGDVKNLNEDEEFVSEEESTERIITILSILSIFLILVASSFTAICIKLSYSSILKKERSIPDEGKNKD